MSRRMNYVVRIDKPAPAVYQDFTTINYWEDLAEFYRDHSLETEIIRFDTDATGTDIAFTHTVSAKDLPAVARPVVQGRFTVTRHQHFDPLDHAGACAAGHYSAVIPKTPVEISGEYVLSDTVTGSQLELQTVCRVKVPIIGGQIEQWTLDGLRTLFATEGEFTAEWLAGHQ